MLSRRSVLLGLVVALAGCTTSGSEPTGGPASTTPTANSTRSRSAVPSTPQPTSTTTPQPTAAPTQVESSLPPHAPQVTFEFTWNPSAGEVTVTHAGGDAITDAATSSMSVDRRNAGTLVFWVADDPTFRRGALGEYPVTEGDSITLSANPGEHVQVTWFDSERQGYVLGEYRVPA